MAPFILASGTLSKIAHLNEAKTTIVEPDQWSHTQAAALGCVWLTARTCIERAEPHVGELKRVVVLGGSSATGMYTILLAKKRGWRILSTCSGRNTDFVKSMGVEDVVDYTQQNVPEHVKAFRPNAIIDCVGGTECLGIANKYVTIVGDKAGQTKMGASMIVTLPHMLLRWLWERFGYGQKYTCITLDQKKEYLEEAKEVLDAESIVIDKHVCLRGRKGCIRKARNKKSPREDHYCNRVKHVCELNYRVPVSLDFFAGVLRVHAGRGVETGRFRGRKVGILTE
jgi:reticulon-4-interacting protein 1, mitochondrial